MNAPRWSRVCALEDIYPDSGVGALIDGQQVAVFRVRGGVYAIGNYDPASGANVLARGIVGDLGGELVVASPIYKQHFSLITGGCLEEPELCVPVFPARINDGQVWVRAEPATLRRSTIGKRRLIVIGNGMAAMRTVEELLELAPGAYDITVFGAEERGGYNRILLSPLLAGAKRVEEIVTHPREWFEQRGIVLHSGDPIVHIDRVRRCVRSRRGIEVPYDRLLIATGSLPIKLPLPGKDLAGVITFRDLADVDAMLEVTKRRGRAVVIGGGLLGLEAASGLALRGMSVTVVHLCEHLMERQLDAHAAGLLRRELESRGLEFVMPAQTVEVLGSAGSTGSMCVSGVRLGDGRELPADLVVMAVGVKPNTELARDAGLRCERGVLVDDTLQTYDPAIYAVGECVQHRDCTFGLVAPLWEQARVCAAYLAERGARRYRSAHCSTQLKVGGIDVFSAGDYAADSSAESLVLRDQKRGIYKRVVIEHGKVRGAVLYGDTRHGGWYVELINQGRNIGALRDQLLFGPPAEATSPAPRSARSGGGLHAVPAAEGVP